MKLHQRIICYNKVDFSSDNNIIKLHSIKAIEVSITGRVMTLATIAFILRRLPRFANSLATYILRYNFATQMFILSDSIFMSFTLSCVR